MRCRPLRGEPSRHARPHAVAPAQERRVSGPAHGQLHAKSQTRGLAAASPSAKMMQAAAPEPPPQPKQTELVNALALRNNLGVLGFVRTFVSLLAGIAVGILGVEGWWGFLPHLATQLLCAPLMVVKGATSPTKYFHTWTNYLFFNVFSSVTLLTFVLFWMIFYNLCHIF